MGEHLDHDALQAIATAAGLTGLKQEHLEQAWVQLVVTETCY